MADNNNHNGRKFTNEVKRHFLEIVSTYSKYQEMMDRKSDIIEIANTLGGITEAARELALNEADDWFDKHTVKRNMSELDKLGKQFDAVATEGKALDQRLVGLYEDMGHILSRYYKVGELTEDTMKKRLGITEGKSEAEQTYDAFNKLIQALSRVQTDTWINDREHDQILKLKNTIFKMSDTAVRRIMNENKSKLNELEIGDKLVHKHIPNVSIELVATTNRGWKVKQTEPKGPKSSKTIIQFYDNQDLKGDKSLFKLINEAVGMDMDARRKMYDKLKKGDKVRITYGSSIKNHDNTFVVTAPHKIVGNQKVGRIILKNVDNIGGVKYFLYNRDGNVSMAISDMAALIKSMELVNESKSSSSCSCGCGTCDKALTENRLIESSMAELDILAKESNSFKEFTKKVYTEFPNLPKTRESLKWLEDMYKTNESVMESNHKYSNSTISYITKHNNEYVQAEKLNKGNEENFYDSLTQIEDKIGHPKYMTWLSNALRGYKVDMYRDPKIKNQGEAEEALYRLSK